MTFTVKTPETAEQVEARKQREQWATLQSSYYDAQKALRAYEARERITRDARGRLMGPGTGDTQLNVYFEKRKVLNKFKTMEAQKPVFDMVDFVIVIPPGLEKDLTVHAPMDSFNEWRFGQEYERWKAGIKEAVDGTPFEEWEHLKDEKAVIDEFKRHGFNTVEQIANGGDHIANVINQFTTWKNLAQKFLANKTKTEAQTKIDDAVAAVRAEYDKKFALLEAALLDAAKKKAKAE